MTYTSTEPPAPRPSKQDRKAAQKRLKKDQHIAYQHTWRAVRPEVWVLIALLAVAGITKVLIDQVPLTPPPDVTPQTAVSYVLTEAVKRFGVVVAVLALLGSVLRAIAHDNPGRKGMDFAGKILAVGATYLTAIAVLTPVIILANETDAARAAFYGQ